MRVPAVRTVVEMRSREEARLEFPEVPGLHIEAAGPDDADAYMALYRGFEGAHLWVSRVGWTQTQFRRLLASDHAHVWLARLDGGLVGFVELGEQPDGSMRLSYLGVVPGARGRGIGKHLLSLAVERAWELGASRFWLYTRNYDGEHALANYLRRGFRVTRTRPRMIEVPPQMEDAARAVVAEAKRRGSYPALRSRLSARLRASAPGRGATWLYGALRRLVHGATSERQVTLPGQRAR